jgi:UDP-N-acetylglucosamine 2-epimerase
MKIVTVVGARPQFIKAAPVSKALRETGHIECLVHTGQHYDYRMSQVFFDEMEIPTPHINLEVGSGSHGWQTGKMLILLEEVMRAENPDAVLGYGDTNSTLAGALAAAKLRRPLAHVEAGLRSFNREMPEEHNRVLTDHCADVAFCPTQTAVQNLARENITRGVHLVGDTMYDATLQFAAIAQRRSTVLRDLNIEPKGYLVATVHRPYNTDVTENLRNILNAFVAIEDPIVFPVHPRTRQRIEELSGTLQIPRSGGRLKLIEPLGYLDMLMLEQHARVILTDSGGMQKEAYFFGVPCITLRPETEWIETVETGWNILTGTSSAEIQSALRNVTVPDQRPLVFGNGSAALEIVRVVAGGLMDV